MKTFKTKQAAQEAKQAAKQAVQRIMLPFQIKCALFFSLFWGFHFLLAVLGFFSTTSFYERVGFAFLGSIFLALSLVFLFFFCKWRKEEKEDLEASQ